tara:strand:+ start:915 stop:1277 length:363 start_codon:yes stop_codon:yes gene_type:complete
MENLERYREIVLEFYDAFEGNLRKVARVAPYTEIFIYNVVRAEGLEDKTPGGFVPTPRGLETPQEKIEHIVDDHFYWDGDIRFTAERNDVSVSIVRKNWAIYRKKAKKQEMDPFNLLFSF